MQIVSTEYQFSQTQAAQCTSADAGTIENYINYKYVEPRLIGGRRRFSLLQLIKIEFVYRLATVCKIAPKTGSKWADQIIEEDRFGLKDDAAALDRARNWPALAENRLYVMFDPKKPDEVGFGSGFVPEATATADSILLIFPARYFARHVLQRAATALEQRGRSGEQSRLERERVTQ